MLVKYRDDYQKTTMGLLSYLPDFHKMAHLKAEMQWYAEGTGREMYLWRNEQQQFTGVVGFEQENDFILIRLLALSPQERNDQTRKAILDAVAELFPDRKLMGTIATTPMLMRWQNLDAR